MKGKQFLEDMSTRSWGGGGGSTPTCSLRNKRLEVLKRKNTQRHFLREAAKKVLLLMAGPLRPNSTRPSSLMAVEICSKKSFFPSWPRPLPPPS